MKSKFFEIELRWKNAQPYWKHMTPPSSEGVDPAEWFICHSLDDTGWLLNEVEHLNKAVDFLNDAILELRNRQR